MPSDRTTVTELGTGLGMLGLAGIDEAVRSRTPVMHSLSPEMWERLDRLRAGGAYDAEFHAAWANGQAFLTAADGLRGRLPRVVEWKGTGRAPGDEVAPIDLRVDHVYLVSCKYLSKILFNVSPASVFDSLLFGGQGRGGRAAREVLPGGGDWYAEVAPAEYQALYEAVRASPRGARGGRGADRPDPAARPERRRPAARRRRCSRASERTRSPRRSRPLGSRGAAPPALLRDLPPRAVDLTVPQRDALGQWLRAGWPPGAKDLYAALSSAVARASVRRWEAAMDDRGGGRRGHALAPPAHRERALLRAGLLGRPLAAAAHRHLVGLAPAVPARRLAMEAQPGGQPRVGWEAMVRDRASHEVHSVVGHIEVRWSHGRFGGLPEAKGYLDTPHHLVPGYFTLR